MEILMIIAIGSLLVGVAIAIRKYRTQAVFVQRCSRKLKDKNWKVRQSAIDDLRSEITAHLRIGKERKARAHHVINLLLRALRDEDGHIRETTAALLANQIDEYPVVFLSSIPFSKKQGADLVSFWLRKSVVRRMVMPFLRAVKDQNPNVRKEAIVALGKIHDRIRDTRVIPPLIMALKDPEEGVRKNAATILGTLNNARTINPLLKALEDNSAIVRRNAARSLENECKSVYTIVFQRGRKSKSSSQKHTVRNPDVSNLTIPMKNLRQIIIDATTCDIQQVEAFASYGTTYLDSTYLKSLVTVSISGDPTIFSERVYELCHLCKEVDVDVETIIFGTTPSKKSPSPRTVYNPDMSAFTLPMPHVKQVVIHTETHNFHQVERFLTYAVNYMGQKPLKKQVDVHIYGDPEKLHPNLHNSLANLCKRVHVSRQICFS